MISVLVGLCYPGIQCFLYDVDGLTDCCFLVLVFVGPRDDFVVYSNEILEDGAVTSDVTEVHIPGILALWSEFGSGLCDKGFQNLLQC